METKQTFFAADVINYALDIIFEVENCKDFEKLCKEYGDVNIMHAYYYLKFIKDHNKNIIPKYKLKFAEIIRKRHAKDNKTTRARVDEKWTQQELIS